MVVTFDQVGWTVTLLPNRATDGDVDTVAFEPPQQPTTIDGVVPKDMNRELRDRLQETLRPFHITFTWAGQAIVRTNVVQHTIDTGGVRPCRIPARRIPFHVRDELDAMLEKLLTQGVINQSYSPWAGSGTLCINCRQLNAVTVLDSLPLPRMDGLLQTLAGKCWFATIDLSSSYWQIEVKPEDRHKTAFILPSGLFEFTTLPMGLANAAATCQRVMQ